MQEDARVAICTQVIKLSASVKYHSHTTAHISVVAVSMGMRLVPNVFRLDFSLTVMCT
jgi:hypothetical protein